jgi:hypothetical protein
VLEALGTFLSKSSRLKMKPVGSSHTHTGT